MSQRVSIVVMAYNEASSLEIVVNEILAFLNQKIKLDYELIIIDDGSTDETGSIAKQLAQINNSIRLIRHSTNLGLGGVYRTGFAESRFDLLTFLPADGQFPPSVIARFIPLLEQFDMVLGYTPERKGPLLSKALSLAERILYRLLFGQIPNFQGVLMFKRSILNQIELKSSGRGWAIILELVIRASREHYKLISIPIEVRPRISGKSKVNNIKTILANLKQAFLLRNYLNSKESTEFRNQK